MSAKPILYDYLFSGNSYKVRLLLSQLEIPFEYRAVDILKGETQEPWFLLKNPIPTRPEEFEAWQRHGDRALRVIEQHLAKRTFFVAERYSIADIALYAYVHKADEGAMNLGS